MKEMLYILWYSSTWVTLRCKIKIDMPRLPTFKKPLKQNQIIAFRTGLKMSTFFNQL